MKKKILIVDDDLIYRKIVQRLLCADYELFLAEDDKQAIEVINNNTIPDLVIADLNIPGVKGLEFIKLMISKIRHLEIPLIVISGMDDDNLKNELIHIGIDSYVQKPVDRNYLKDLIKSFV